MINNNMYNDIGALNAQQRQINREQITQQRHVHEFEESVKIAEPQDPHNHRFAGISGEAIGSGTSHVHRINARTDFYEDHFHLIDQTTGPAIAVGEGKHVHFVSGFTSRNEGHRHEFKLATLIEDPIGD